MFSVSKKTFFKLWLLAVAGASLSCYMARYPMVVGLVFGVVTLISYFIGWVEAKK